MGLELKMACALHRSLGKQQLVRGDRQPQGLEVLEGALDITLEHRALPLRHPAAEQRDLDASIH